MGVVPRCLVPALGESGRVDSSSESENPVEKAVGVRAPCGWFACEREGPGPVGAPSRN